MTSPQKNAPPAKRETGLSSNSKAHGSKEQEWLRQSDGDEPWKGFTAVATDRQNWQSHVPSARSRSQSWSTQAEGGSQEESSTG
ncbi:hypothetical protein FVEG_15299 [Fusarium verticillioides 7600]|uniref:Uncharacterized protein n=1 Tax=Gibberella moniliformis (strain M3125 / FGSC 7600) TaxID=334819 RepID=W7LQR1_GIBM7|nr:hypothetical protein FVEG_15299 [Fusarium verticillioides 7600]EWG41518.1 hypothetical protein FVEG_15299 [Fusarium verticillioides 7600]